MNVHRGCKSRQPFRWLSGAFLLISLALLGCNRTPPPPTDPASLERETERLKLEHQREMENR
jgi:hypothetical protein